MSEAVAGACSLVVREIRIEVEEILANSRANTREITLAVTKTLAIVEVAVHSQAAVARTLTRTIHSVGDSSSMAIVAHDTMAALPRETAHPTPVRRMKTNGR